MRLLSKPRKFDTTAHREGRTVERLVSGAVCVGTAVKAASWSLPIIDGGHWRVWQYWPSCRWWGDQCPPAGSMAEDATEILRKTCAGDKGANLGERYVRLMQR